MIIPRVSFELIAKHFSVELIVAPARANHASADVAFVGSEEHQER